ncbi:MAG: winged helix-turn-helix domain-containing protein [Xanthomonadales bacterium]|nr:winged helix-turn-helix domain-containing protein [Xanthomonadales bacterium]
MNNTVISGFRIGAWDVYPQQNLLKSPEHTKTLEPKVMDVLVFLSERQGEVVSRQQILEAVWREAVVGDEVVSRAMSLLRTELGDDQKNPRYVKTISKRGYCLIADVILVESISDASASVTADNPTESTTRRTAGGSGNRLAFVIIGLLALSLGYFAFDKFVLDPVEDEQNVQSARQEGLTAALTESGGDQSIAVLPFDNRSDREEDQFFTDGIHDDLVTTIAKIGSMKVISRTSVMEYKDTIKKLPQIAKELGVANILEGGIQRSGDKVRINVQLIDAATDNHLWAEIYERELTAENLFAVQSEITKVIADALETELSTDEQRRIDARPTDNLQAYDAYMRGRQLMATRDSARLKLAAEEFGKATNFDPLFALAWVGVADSNMLLSSHSAYRIEDLLPIREEAVKNALAIDNDLGEAYASLANIHAYYNRKGEAETAYQKAIELSPNYASAYYWYSSFLGIYPLRIQEQVELARKAAELDPRSSSLSLNLGSKYLNQGLYTLAEGQFQKVIELDPGFAPGYAELAWLYIFYMGQFDKALPLANKAVELDPVNHGHNMVLVFLYISLRDPEAAQIVRERMASLGASESRLGFADVLINFIKSLTTQKPADTLESINRLLPKIRHSRSQNQIVAFVALTQGDIQLSREIILTSNPGWLEPGQWPKLVERWRKNACTVAWVLMNTGDEKLGSALLRQAISYIDDSLPLAVEHSDWDHPELCYLAAGDTEKALLSIETQLSHNHLFAWYPAQLLPMYDQIRHEPRYQAAWAEFERRIGVQRENIEKMAAD